MQKLDILNQFHLTGQTALVTGASGTIGHAIAKTLHALGAYVYISGRKKEKLEQLADELGDRNEIKLCDIKDFDSCANMMSTIDKLNILVCNAGITDDSLTIRMSNEKFSNVIETNLTSTFILNREAIKKMLPHRFGRIINIASVLAVAGNPGQANYCASKAGIIGMSKSISLEVASKNITVNVIAPGFIQSNMTDKLNNAQKESIMQKIPMKRLGQASDLQGIICFLASDLSSYITGHTFHVNGGMLQV